MEKEKKQKVIVGYDPGNIFGLAIISLNAELNAEPLLVISGKSRKDLTKDIISFGIPIALGSDKSNPSKEFLELAKKLRAHIIKPEIDLKISKKRALIEKELEKKGKKIHLRNKHEIDALAAALFALKKLRPLLSKIKTKLKERKNRSDVESDIEIETLYKIIKEKLNIKQAEQLI
ncbi:MAG: DUF460 domain-containing protein [Candidatus Pacearchaeota archaeon]